jgi:hypothetical protein
LRRQVCDSKSVAKLVEERGPWAGLLFERLILWADDEGRVIAEPCVVKARCIPWHNRSLANVAGDLKCMDSLGLIALYQVDGTQYACFPNWHKHQPKQKNDRYIPSEIPSPPGTVASSGGSSEADRLQSGGESVPDCRQFGASSESVRSAEDEEEVEGQGEGVRGRGLSPLAAGKPPPPRSPGKGGNEARSRSPGRCGWCEKPKPADAAPTDRLLQDFHDGYRAKFGSCPTISPGKEARRLLAVLKAGKTQERVKAVILHGLDSQDTFLAKRGFTLSAILDNFDGIALSLDRGERHGETRQHSGAGARRHLPSPESEFSDSGLVAL